MSAFLLLASLAMLQAEAVVTRRTRGGIQAQGPEEPADPMPKKTEPTSSELNTNVLRKQAALERAKLLKKYGADNSVTRAGMFIGTGVVALVLATVVCVCSAQPLRDEVHEF